MKSVIELREVSILRSKLSVSLLQWRRQCNDLLTFIILLISELICQLVYMQLVSLLQWHDNIFNNKQIYKLVSTSKSSVSLLQWRCQCNDLLILIILLISESIC